MCPKWTNKSNRKLLSSFSYLSCLNRSVLWAENLPKSCKREHEVFLSIMTGVNLLTRKAFSGIFIEIPDSVNIN